MQLAFVFEGVPAFGQVTRPFWKVMARGVENRRPEHFPPGPSVIKIKRPGRTPGEKIWRSIRGEIKIPFNNHS